MLAGRPFYWALAGGRAGVERAIDIMQAEIGLALPLLGYASTAEVSCELITALA